MNMSLDKSRIPKLGDSSRKFIPEKQRRAMTDPFVERITRTRTDKGETVSGRMVETRSQKSSEERKAMLEVELHPDQAINENQEIHGPEGRDRRLASEQQRSKGTTGINRGTIWTRGALVQIAVRRTIMCQHVQFVNRA